MIVLYGGRLVLERRSLSQNWKATLKIPAKGKVTIDLGTPDVREAFIRGQNHYLAVRTDRSVQEIEEETSSVTKCWSCLNWLPRSNKCSFGFPEARQTGGRYAAKCELYADGTEDPRSPRPWEWPVD